jgi:hypothetical protein
MISGGLFVFGTSQTRLGMVGIRFGNYLFLFGIGCNYWALCYYFCIATSATIGQALWIFSPPL